MNSTKSGICHTYFLKSLMTSVLPGAQHTLLWVTRGTLKSSELTIIDPVFPSYYTLCDCWKCHQVLLSAKVCRWTTVLSLCSVVGDIYIYIYCLWFIYKLVIYRSIWWCEKSISVEIAPRDSVSYFLAVTNKHHLSLEVHFIKHFLSLSEKEIGLSKNYPFSK